MGADTIGQSEIVEKKGKKCMKYVSFSDVCFYF